MCGKPSSSIETFHHGVDRREIEKDNRLWYTLPFDQGWGNAEASGVEPGMTALRNGGLVLALFRGGKEPGQVFAVGLSGTMEDIITTRAKPTPDTQIDVYQPDRIEFVDPYHITWQIAVGPIIDTAGHFANRWFAL